MLGICQKKILYAWHIPKVILDPPRRLAQIPRQPIQCDAHSSFGERLEERCEYCVELVYKLC